MGKKVRQSMGHCLNIYDVFNTIQKVYLPYEKIIQTKDSQNSFDITKFGVL